MGFTKLERVIALRYLSPSRKEGQLSLIALFSFIGIMLGVAALIIVMSVMNGFRQDLLNNILGFKGHICLYSKSVSGINNHKKIIQSLHNIKAIKSATPLIEEQSIVSVKQRYIGAIVNGINQKDLQSKTIISQNIIHGSLDKFSDQSAVIGYKMALNLGLAIGDTISIVSPSGTNTAFGTIPKIRPMKITAIFKVGMSNYDKNVIFIPLPQAQTFFNYPESVNSIEIFTYNPEKINALKNNLLHNFSNFKIIDWQQANSVFFNSLKVEKNVMFIILTLIILVAALNIISSLVMLVKDKAKNIAILRTMGTGKYSIMKIFFLTGFLIGASGIIFGVILGLLFTYHIESIRQWLESFSGANLFSEEIYFLSTLPAQVEITEVITVVLTAMILVFISSIIPAWRAAKLNPIEILRHE